MQAVQDIKQTSQTLPEKIDRARDLEKQLRERDALGYYKLGVVYEEVARPDGSKSGLLHIANPYQQGALEVKTLPTRCTREQAEAICSRIIPMRETQEMMVALAKAYEMRSLVLLEGGTSIGKTFTVNRFVELLYGPGVKPLDFYCTEQTDSSELLGKYVPKTQSADDKARLNKFIFSDEGRKWISEQRESGALGSLDTPQSIVYFASMHLGIPVDENDFEFQLGALPKAAMGEISEEGSFRVKPEGGRGFVLHVQELGQARPVVTNVFLRVRGDSAQLVDSFQLWEDGGSEVRFGPDTFIVFSTNPPEAGYLERNEVDPALARGTTWVRFGERLDSGSVRLASDKIFQYDWIDKAATGPGILFDLRQSQELRREISEIVSAFHVVFTEKIKHGETGGRRQKIPASLDDISRCARQIFASQVPDYDRGTVDWSATIRRAAEFVYIGRLADEGLKKELRAVLDESLTGTATGPKEFRGAVRPRAQILSMLTSEAVGSRITEHDLDRDIARRKQLADAIHLFCSLAASPGHSLAKKAQTLKLVTEKLGVPEIAVLERALESLEPATGYDREAWGKDHAALMKAVKTFSGRAAS